MELVKCIRSRLNVEEIVKRKMVIMIKISMFTASMTKESSFTRDRRDVNTVWIRFVTQRQFFRPLFIHLFNHLEHFFFSGLSLRLHSLLFMMKEKSRCWKCRKYNGGKGTAASHGHVEGKRSAKTCETWGANEDTTSYTSSSFARAQGQGWRESPSWPGLGP